MKELLERYSGAVCEVKTLENELIFIGRMRSVIKGLSLSLDIVPLDGSPLPGSRYGVPVKLSLYKNAGNMLVVGGKVYMANLDFWRISNISEYQNFERRGFFRVQANVDASVAQLLGDEETADEYPAHILNISLSGLLFASPRRFESDENVVLSSVRLTKERWPFTFTCHIGRADEENPLGFLHRCKFLDMEQREADRLCKAIFSLQREAIKKGKNRL